MKIIAPLTTIRAGGLLRDYALDLVSIYSQIERSKSGDNAIYDNVPDTADIKTQEYLGILAVGGEIEGLPTFIKVADLTQEIPAGLLYSTKIVDDVEVQKTWQDLETSTNKWTASNDGEQFIGTQALKGGLFTGTECKQYLDSGVNVLTLSEIKPFLVISEL